MEKETLSHLYDLAYRAHTGTSFSPEKRAKDLIESHAAELNADLESMPEGERESYKAGYLRHLTAWLGAKGNCVSTMIAGGSNFNVRRAEKANSSEHKRSVEFTEWREKALAAIARRKEQARPQAQKDDEAFERIRKQIMSSAATIIGIDNGTVRGCARALFVSNLVNRIKTIARNGNVELLAKSLELIRQINAEAAKPIISTANSIWKLGEVAEAKREQRPDKADAENDEFPFDGGAVIINWTIDRVQIRHNQKPEQSVIGQLKHNAFHWSPVNGCWQRKITPNAVLVAAALTEVNINSK
jgi:hypothetical protein